MKILKNILFVVLIVALGYMVYEYYFSSNSISSLNAIIESNTSKYAELQKEYNAIGTSYEAAQDSIQELQDINKKLDVEVLENKKKINGYSIKLKIAELAIDSLSDTDTHNKVENYFDSVVKNDTSSVIGTITAAEGKEVLKIIEQNDLKDFLIKDQFNQITLLDSINGNLNKMIAKKDAQLKIKEIDISKLKLDISTKDVEHKIKLKKVRLQRNVGVASSVLLLVLLL